MLQKPTKQVCAFASESWESAESKFTSTCTGKGRKSIRSRPAREHRDTATENEMAKEIQKDRKRGNNSPISVRLRPAGPSL